MAIILLHMFWDVVFLDACEKQRWWAVAAIVISHFLGYPVWPTISYFKELKSNAKQCALLFVPRLLPQTFQNLASLVPTYVILFLMREVPNSGFEREMTCRTWGQYNFETFDGLYYYLPGRCAYTLLRDCEETTQASIVVQVHNDPACTSDPYTCQRSVSLFLPWEGEVRLHATNVTFKGQSLQLPHHIHDLQLEQISQYVLVTQQHGFTLAWEGRSGSVYIKLSPEFVGRTCGLCGNFNADVHDDLKMSYGVLTHEIEMFGNSWVETHPHEERCPMVPSGFPSPCATVESHVLLKVEEVCAMLLDPPFQSCHDFVSPLSYMASCSNDLCMSDPNGDVVCQVFTEYARACAHADHPLHEWRQHIPQCVKRCSLGLQHRECISCCPESCNLERTCIDSKLTCLDGCYCPDGLIYEDGGCVMPSDCPCEYHGMFYPSGQTLQEECNTCACVGGVWNCTDYSCPGECSVTGDMYFQSFDGRIYTFPATCQYVLAKSRNSAKFTVTIQNTACGANLDGACIQSVNLVIDEDPRTEITLSHIGEVFIAGQYRISLPYSDDLFHIQELSSMFVQVRTAFGLRLQYSWKEFRLYLQADELWKDDTVGLCGTFNGNIQDDFLSPSGMIESTPQLFGNAWKVSSACLSSLSTPQLDPCDTHQQAVTYASEMCDVLNQDLFAACHEYLSPTPFHQQCRSDTCKCGTPCLCSSLAHYARHCRRFSVIIDFRSQISDCAVTCPANMQYGTCVSSCQRRCSSLSVPQHCGEECEEGCVCPLGSFYNHRTHTCVHRSECPCSFLGADYEPGDVIMTSAGVQLCLNGRLVSQTQTGTDRLCPEGQIYQNCSEGEDGLLPGRGVSCERTCESYLLNLTCSSHEPCLAGCVCPPGLLKHGDECFEPAACPCLWKGKEYYPGDRVSSPCYQCVCQHGTFQCVFQPCPSLCTAYGDRHYRTFDGLLFDYVGACKVYLVKSSADIMLSVTAENIDCFDSGIICRKSLLINVGRSFVAFDDDTGKPNHSSVIDRKQIMFIWPAGYFTAIHFPEEDVTVLWDRKTTVHVQVGPRWQGKLSGLCGNFDLKTVNEMRTPDNIDSPTPQEFGNSWTATECVNSPDIRHPCTLSPLREPFAKRQCAVLLSEIFQACHPVVDVTWFYMNCLADTCACSRGGDCECFCTSVAAYAQRCCHQGVPVDWRSPSLCPYDCEFYNKVLGKGPFRLFTFRDRTTLLAASKSSSFVFLQRGNISDTPDIISLFMMTPGLSRARPHDMSRVSFEAADRPNYFLSASPNGQLTLAKWQESEAFWERATFILRRNTWIPGYDSLESHAKPGFFLYAAVPRLYLIKYKHLDSFRKATLFKLSGPNPDAPPAPRCQWRYDACVSPCFKTCSDPFAEACITIPQVEGCLPVCPPLMVLDEVTHRCVYIEDCIKVPVAVQPVTPSAAQPAATSTTTASTTASTSTFNTTTSTTAASAAPPHTAPTTKITSTVPEASLHTSSSETPPAIISPSASPEPSSTIEPPMPPAVPTPVRPEVVEPLSTVKVTVAPPTTIMGTTKWLSGPLSSAVSPFGPSTSRTSSTSFTTTPLFWLTSTTKSTDSLQPLFTITPVTTESATTTAAPTTTSLEGTTTRSTPIVVQTTEATTHSTRIAPIITASSPSPALVPETSPPYAEIVDDCTKYICVNNQLVLFNKSQSCPYTADPPNCGLLGFAILVNGDKCCPKWDCPCRCTMFPDLNVITFDGNSVAIYKAASFIVTQLPNETVSVLVQECPADSQSPLFWNFTNLCLVALNITHKSNHIIINRLQRRLYVNSRYAKPRFKKYGFEIYDTGNMYLIRSPAGLKLQWYHSTGMMVIDTDSSSNKLPTMGLCGFCDGDPSNDLILANGTTVGESEDPAVFIDSWQIPNTTSYISHSRRRELNCSTSDCSSCFFMLQNQAFTPCHAFVPPTTFCEVWVRDSEYVNNQCVALAAYVASCHKFNICIEWRSPNYCPFVCPNTLRYQACLPACTSQSCPNHDFDSDPDQCSGLTEGCVCPEGTLLHRPYSALCIPPDKCACTDSGGVPRAHGEVWKASKDACCMYRCDNDTIVPVEYNCSSMVAPACRRAGEVIISLADDTSCCPQKVCVCNQSLCDQLPPECKYGEKLVSYYRQDSCCPDYVCECDPVLCESDIPTCRDDQILIATRAEGSCCLAHICMCAPCVETPPLCQDGEILTVDSNTTDRCCPTYQCVCEPYRCPQLTCPVGMSVVSVSNPGHCCPNQTCGGGCPAGPGLSSRSTEPVCLQKIQAVCVFGERGVLRPGQTLVERGDDGLCYSRQCSRSLDPASGFHVLHTFSVNCSNQCQPNQIYVPPKDQSTCCGICKNISCIYEHENGTTGLYKPGRSWVSNCMKFDCTDTVAGPTLISYSFSCPPFNETECVKIGGTVVSYMDGCCKTCKEDGKSCQKVTVRMTIRKNDCRSNRPVNIVSCDGKCPSASIYNYNINTYARFCKCCRETGLQRRSVQLYCSSNSTWVSYTIQEPTDCSCQWS
ncbi:otogelin [Pundamilia nyererei]|uniref:Gamma-secretase subunit APH-1 n=1 Tax=Pundamilia nyererei TaxID=303518 RepID=A0A9Y6SJC6_9CICH|nr:PREDICTED: otogelin [Pundamilia nyererei]